MKISKEQLLKKFGNYNVKALVVITNNKEHYILSLKPFLYLRPFFALYPNKKTSLKRSSSIKKLKKFKEI